MFGDSLAQGFAYGVRQAVRQRGDYLADARVSEDVRIGIGLIPRRGLDPVVEIASVLATAQPPYDAVIVSLGVNDVGMPLGPVAFYGEAWQQAYRARLDAFADAVAVYGTPVAWIQVPAVRPPAFAGPLDATIRGLQDAEMGAHPGVVLVDTATLTGTGGTFQTHMVDADGTAVRLRAGDGIHFTAAGYVEVARRALDALAPRIPPPVPAPVLPPAPPPPSQPALTVDTQPPPVPQPLTPVPLTPVPLTPEPLTPQPLTPQPLTPQPLAPAPHAPIPLTPVPLAPVQPVETERPIGVERPVAATPGAPLPLVPIEVNPRRTGPVQVAPREDQ
ncbi:MAG: DUF459 domain-containing protein [Rhodospirillaceae bacterium]|nr:DUF459 domain-containing protein [Rhodospirillaceae bacterium]